MASGLWAAGAGEDAPLEADKTGGVSAAPRSYPREAFPLLVESCSLQSIFRVGGSDCAHNYVLRDRCRASCACYSKVNKCKIRTAWNKAIYPLLRSLSKISLPPACASPAPPRKTHPLPLGSAGIRLQALARNISSPSHFCSLIFARMGSSIFEREGGTSASISGFKAYWMKGCSNLPTLSLWWPNHPHNSHHFLLRINWMIPSTFGFGLRLLKKLLISVDSCARSTAECET